MRLKKNTLLLAIAAICFGSLVYIFEIRREQQLEQILTQEQKVLNLNISDIQKIVVTNSSHTTLEFVPLNNNWQLKNPEQGIVNNGVMAFLLDLIAEGKSDRSIEISSPELAQYGLEPPLGTISIELVDGSQQQIILGKETIDSNLIYARIITQSNEENNKLLLVSKNWQYAIERDLAEWTEGIND